MTQFEDEMSTDVYSMGKASMWPAWNLMFFSPCSRVFRDPSSISASCRCRRPCRSAPPPRPPRSASTFPRPSRSRTTPPGAKLGSANGVLDRRQESSVGHRRKLGDGVTAATRQIDGRARHPTFGIDLCGPSRCSSRERCRSSSSPRFSVVTTRMLFFSRLLSRPLDGIEVRVSASTTRLWFAPDRACRRALGGGAAETGMSLLLCAECWCVCQ